MPRALAAVLRGFVLADSDGNVIVRPFPAPHVPFLAGTSRPMRWRCSTMVGRSGREPVPAEPDVCPTVVSVYCTIWNLPAAGFRRSAAALFFLALVVVGGCSEVELPSWVPFQGPASDTLPGYVSPGERITELRKLSETAVAKSPEEKVRISDQLAVAIQTEKDPLVRLEIVRTLGHYPGPPADAILARAVYDDDVQVRVVACEGWGRRGGDQAVKLLAELMHSDVNVDVRLAAAKALGETRSPTAVAPLGEALNDRDPAMQYQAVLALEQATGKDFGADVGRWQRYLKDGQQEPPGLAERMGKWF